MTDHQYHIVESPRKLKAQLKQSNAEVVGLKKNLKTSQQKSHRLRRRVKSLKAIVKVVHEKFLISSGCEAMLKQTFSGGKGNCQQEDPTQLLHSFDDTCKVGDQDITISNAALIRKYDLTERRPVQSDHDYCDSPNMANLIEYKKAAISYIAGYVAKMVVKQTLCTQCCTARGSTKSTTMSSFLKMKDRGGLFKPTQSVITVCEETERRFQRMLTATGGEIPQGMYRVC